MKIVDNIRIFNKINRKFYKKNSVKRVDKLKNGKRLTSYWFEKDWIGYLMNTRENSITEAHFENIENEINTMLNNLNNSFTYNNEEYVLKGILLTNRDVYWYCTNKKDGNVYLINLYNKIF